MMARDRHYGKGRRGTVKTRVGIATALLVGGAVAAGAVVASNHGAASVATSAGYSTRYNSEGSMISSALSDWSWSRQGTYSQLARLTQARQFSQTWHHGRLLAVQRGIVVLATRRFLIVRSANGSLHLWLLSGHTRFQNVSNTTAGTQALTANTTATQQAMTVGNMVPATNLLAGGTTTAAAMLTPAAAPQTVTVQVANTNLTVTVTITRTTATVHQTATMPANTLPTWSPIMFRQNAWQAANRIARGDLALVVGFRAHWTLHAQLVLFTPLSTAAIGGNTGTGATPTATPGTATQVTAPTAQATHW